MTITDPIAAARVSEAMLRVAADLNDSLIVVQERCPEAEFVAYRKVVGVILGETYFVIKPLYDTHPGLKPPGLFE